MNNDWIKKRVPFPYRSPIGKLRSSELRKQKKKKRTFRELKSGEYFQSAAESRKNQKHKQVWSVSDGGAARCTWHEM